jgi:WD40 repeat protein
VIGDLGTHARNRRTLEASTQPVGSTLAASAASVAATEAAAGAGSRAPRAPPAAAAAAGGGGGGGPALGVHEFVYSARSKLLASCGVSRHVAVWNPFASAAGAGASAAEGESDGDGDGGGRERRGGVAKAASARSPGAGGGGRRASLGGRGSPPPPPPPPSSHRPLALLRGHVAPVCKLAVDDGRQLLLSLASDKELRVWDLKALRCVHALREPFLDRPDNRLGALAWDGARGRLLAASSTLRLWAVRATLRSGALPPAAAEQPPLVGALFSKQFGQFVTADGEGSVHVWDARTGAYVRAFARAHGDARLSAVALDAAGRRLLTGGSDGGVRLSNLANGARARSLCDNRLDASAAVGIERDDDERAAGAPTGALPPPPAAAARRSTARPSLAARRAAAAAVVAGSDARAEQRARLHAAAAPADSGRQRQRRGQRICALLCTHEPQRNQRQVVAAGWHRRVSVWNEDAGGARSPYPERALSGHTDDVLALAVCREPALIASAAYDGVVLVHAADSGALRCACAPAPAAAAARGRIDGRAIEALAFLPTCAHALVGAGADGALHVWAPLAGGRRVLSLRSAASRAAESVCCLATDCDGGSGRFVFAADTAGFVKVRAVRCDRVRSTRAGRGRARERARERVARPRLCSRALSLALALSCAFSRALFRSRALALARARTHTRCSCVRLSSHTHAPTPPLSHHQPK